ncbi:MAG: VOC family protein [Alphaproteobacteria bacterium]|nr:VOC family protein [Alphaproteobacteria bacterium]
MRPALTMITLGVADLPRARAFYSETLGWRPVLDLPEVVFYDLAGFRLALFGEDALAADIGLPAARAATGFRGVTLAHNLNSRAAVDALFSELAAKGVHIVKPPQAADWGGYSGYVADPDGHLWELAYNPAWRIDEASGRVAEDRPL